MNKKFVWLSFIFIFVFAGIVRLYKLSNPIADWHSWRQTDTAAVSKIYVENGIDPLHPRYYDISNIQSGTDNPQGYRMVEFPLFNIIHATLSQTFGIFTVDEWGRLTTIIFSLVALTFIFLIVKRYFNERAALIAAFFYAFLPFSIYYGRSVLPDTAMIASVLGGIYFFALWSDKKFTVRDSLFTVLPALLFTVASLLFKPYAIIFLLPMVVIAIEKFGIGFLKKWQLWVFAILSVLPLALWRVWILQFPEGIPASSWLLNGGNIRFKGAWFYWIFGERISKLILGYYTVFAIVGIFKRTFEKHFAFFASFLVSSLIYLIIIARGNVQHDYYQILIIPSLAIGIGRGVDFLLSQTDRVNKVIAPVAILFITFLMLSLSWYYVRDYFNINNPGMVEAGQKADHILPKDAKVIAPLDGDTTLLYYINRPGWPAFEASTEELIQKGATHMLLLHPDANAIIDLTSKYQVIASESGYIILDLRK